MTTVSFTSPVVVDRTACKNLDFHELAEDEVDEELRERVRESKLAPRSSFTCFSDEIK